MIRSLAILLLLCSPGWAVYQTANFRVTAPSAEWEKAIGDAAEAQRKELAELWLGKELPAWPVPCVVRVQLAQGNGGSTVFGFDNGQAVGFDMSVKGTPERLIDSVLPHEITHTIFATHFGRPVPRWMDEGAASTVEHPAERIHWERSIEKCLKTKRAFSSDQLMLATEYPPDYEAFYAQGYSLSSFLILKDGHRNLIRFVEIAFEKMNWDVAATEVYGFTSVYEMQTAWVQWLKSTPGPMRYTVGQCGSCGGCPGGACPMPSYGWQPANVIRVPSRPSVVPPPPTATQPQPTPDYKEVIDQQAGQIANLQSELAKLQKQCGQYKECQCGDCCKQVAASIDTKIAAAIGGIKIPQPQQPQPPNYDAIAAEVAKRLPPINMRVSDAAPYQPMKLGSYVTLPLDKNP